MSRLLSPSFQITGLAIARQSPPQIPYVALLLIWTQLVLLAYSAAKNSPTRLEPALLSAGISNWELQRYELYCVNPPLVRMVAAIPALCVGYSSDWSCFDELPDRRPEFCVGRDFIRANGRRSVRLIILARWMCIPFALLGGAVTYLWSREMWKSQYAGAFALFLWTFDPTVLANGCLITNDVPAASMGLAAAYAQWRWLRRPNWHSVFFSGMFLGLAIATKFVWLFLPPLWGILFVKTMIFGRSETSRRSQCVQFLSQLVIAAAVVNVIYSFDGAFSPLRQYRFRSRLLTGLDRTGVVGNRFSRSFVGMALIPLPRQMLIGCDTEMCDLEEHKSLHYLDGQWSKDGSFFFYVHGFFYKSTHAFQALVLCGIIAFCWHYRFVKRLILTPRLVAVATPAVLFGILSAHTTMNEHYRYVIPCLAFLFVGIGILPVLLARCRSLRHLTTVFGIWIAIAPASAFPRSISYFNELSGGPSNGARHLLGSSLDWGQDLFVLQALIESRQIDEVFLLADYGYDPADIGIKVSALSRSQLTIGRRNGCWVAISTTALHCDVEFNDSVLRDLLFELRDKTPDLWAGASIALFYISAVEA